MTFGPGDRVAESSHNDPLVVSVRLNKYEIKRMVIDTRSSVNLMIFEVYNKLGLDKNRLTKVSYPLVRLEDKIVAVLGTVNLLFMLGDEKHKREICTEFVAVDIPLAYNVILGCSILNYHGIFINMGYLCLNMGLFLLAPRGVMVV